MCFIEYNWMTGSYQFRIGQTFTDYRGVRSFETLKEWREYLKHCGARVGRKTASRSWEVLCLD